MTKKSATRPTSRVRRPNRIKAPATTVMSESERDTIEAIALAREVLGPRVPSPPPPPKRRRHS
jgi:hypothetical protein